MSLIEKSRLLAHVRVGVVTLAACAAAGVSALDNAPKATEQDKHWLLGTVPQPADNVSTPERVELGRALFFDPRLSGNGTLSCATCHNPALGWSDGLRTGVGINGTVLGRATPTVVNTAYNTQFMWDGRKKSLEDQALGPMKTPEEMKTDFGNALTMLKSIPGYREQFARAYPGEPIAEETVAKAIAAFERTVVSNDSRFDRWVAGDQNAITLQEWRGYQVFKDAGKGFNIRKAAVLKGAFKTPTLRDIELTGPYFHNGTAVTLMDVVDHYARGGDDRSNLSKDVRQLDLNQQDKLDLVAFMKALTGAQRTASVPALPQ
jgi:cytochrome c peroxidase